MADLAKIVDDLSALTVLEASELSKMLEEKWGVSAAAPVAVAAAGRCCRRCRSGRREDRIRRDPRPRSARTRSTSSRKSVPSPAWASAKPRRWSKALPRPSRKASTRPKPTTSRPSSKPPAPRSSSSKSTNALILPERPLYTAVPATFPFQRRIGTTPARPPSG